MVCFANVKLLFLVLFSCPLVFYSYLRGGLQDNRVSRDVLGEPDITSYDRIMSDGDTAQDRGEAVGKLKRGPFPGRSECRTEDVGRPERGGGGG